MAGETVFGLDEILELLPHRPPFLFVDRITSFKPGVMIESRRVIRPDEVFLAGHFPGNPVMPGVLVIDGLAQTSGLLWGFTKKARGGEPSAAHEIFYLAAVNVKLLNPAFPGDTLVMTARAEKEYNGLFSYAVEASVGRTLIARGTLTLARVKGTP